MRLETKFVQVPNDPSTINAINNLAAVWGWTVQSIQVTDSKVSYEGDSYGWVTDYGVYVRKEIVTEHTNYASITYQRDMDIKNYTQLCAYEESYNDCDRTTYLASDELAQMQDAESKMNAYNKRIKLSVIIGISCLVIGVFGISWLAAIGNLLLCYGCFIWGMKFFGFSKKYGEWENIKGELTNKDNSLRDKAKQAILAKAKAA